MRNISGHTRFLADISKSAVAIIHIKYIGSEIGDVDLRISVVINISNGHSHSIAGITYARFLGDIFIASAPFVSE